MFEELVALRDKIKTYVDRRLSEFRELGKTGKTTFDFRPFADYVYGADIFSELCFCLLTANSSALIGIKLQSTIGTEGFRELSLEELEKLIASAGHRFARQRAERIVRARERFERVMEVIVDACDGKTVRELLSDTCSKYKVEGFGLKEASHFLRNIGFEDVAIVDRHIFRYLKEKSLIPDYRTMTRKVYLEAEKRLEEICKILGMSQAELDLYIFYHKTGKVLK
ncbi:MAG: N-glycosylase/DNA lyase [Aquificaceae bacterium]|uniref:N-glycosylase/DNA lyase n=1 Tax=Hydrogenobacter sp. Uz 6-8 TaxID=3384828 RepID=UPI0030A61F12